MTSSNTVGMEAPTAPPDVVLQLLTLEVFQVPVPPTQYLTDPEIGAVPLTQPVVLENVESEAYQPLNGMTDIAVMAKNEVLIIGELLKFLTMPLPLVLLLSVTNAPETPFKLKF